MSFETYKDVKGYEGLYQISNLGNVKNKHGLTLKPRVIRGYLTAHLSKSGKAKNVRVHRLVAEAFIPNPDNLPVVNHIDCNKTNNNSNNLEWCSHSHNDKHAYLNGLRKSPKYWTGKTGELHCKSIKVRCVETGQIFPSITEANKQFNTTHVSDCIRGTRKHTNGYTWEVVK